MTKFTTELPIGIKDEGEVLNVFSINDLTVEQLKVIQNKNFKSDHPMVWLGNTLSRVIKDIGNKPVSAEFRAKKDKIPQPVRELTLIDVSYALLCGHVHNLGTDLPPFKSICPACQNHVSFEVDLEEDLDLPEIDLEPDQRFEVELPSGYEHTAKNAEDIGMKGKIWNRYTFRIPKLQDAIRNERHWSGASSNTFAEHIMADCLISARTEDGEEMPDDVRQMIHQNLLLKLPVRDMKAIGRSYGDLAPSFRFLTNVQCNKCGRGVEVPLDPNFLFTTG